MSPQRAAQIVIAGLEGTGRPLTEANIRTAAREFEARMLAQGVTITDTAQKSTAAKDWAEMSTHELLATPEGAAWMATPPRSF